MKTNQTLKLALFAAGFSAIALIGSARAQVVNVDFNTSPSSSGTYAGLGADASDSGTFWNAAGVVNGASASSPTYGSFLESDGVTAATGITANLTSSIPNLDAFDASGNPAGFAPALLNDFGYPQGDGSTLTLTLGGLTAGASYSLYLYTQNGGYNSNVGTWDIAGQTPQTITNNGAGGSDLSGFVNNGNYVEFTNVIADGSGDIVASALNTGTNNGINGFQLVLPVVTEAPEPTSVALIGLGALALLISLRRRTA